MIRYSLLLLLSVSACGSQTPACRINADCASGLCNPNGSCALHSGGDSGAGDQGTPIDTDDGRSPGDATVMCRPNNDQVISRDELVFPIGYPVKFRVASGDVPVQTAGVVTDGTTVWDLSGTLPNDHDYMAENVALGGLWFGADFTGATFASRTSDVAPYDGGPTDLMTIAEITDSAMLLRGVASPVETDPDGVPNTEITYDPPATAMALPLTLGASWTSDANATGHMAYESYGIWYRVPTMLDTYLGTIHLDVKVDGIGRLVTPYGTFPSVMRVSTTATQSLMGVPMSIVRSKAFVTDCFDTVATVRSQANETNDEFASAAEVWRLADVTGSGLEVP